MLLSEGQMSDHKGASLVLDVPCRQPNPDRRQRLRQHPVPPGARRQRHRTLHPVQQKPENPLPYDKALYRQRHKVENLFAKLKDWRRIATRYDRCAHTFFSAICIAASVIFWL
jgi:transposase